MKYDLSSIMKRALKFYHCDKLSLSNALKKSWKIEKRKDEKEILLDKYKHMIYKVSWKIAKKMNVEYDEAKSQAYLIFCESIKTYDKNKSSFSTYLFQRLYGYLTAYFNKNKLFLYNEHDKFEDCAFEKFCKVIEFYDRVSSKELTEDAKIIIDFILDKTFKKISIYDTAKYFNLFYNWTYQRCIHAWNEIKRWWEKNNYCYA
jgi:hypothetical protein